MQIEFLGERYQLQDPIGRGGMATIYRGQDTRMERTVAIKVLREVYSTDPKFVTRFQREAKAASSLQHPNIVQVYDYGQSDGNYFIVMELIEGTDLRRYLRSRGVLAIDRAIIIAHDVALGLGAAHRRAIVHRDVKPQNVLVGRDGSIKLTDFGIASVYKDINAERLTTTGMTLGTVQYYAPEQAQGEIVSPAADVYALGIVMYEMLTGRTPFDGDTPVAVAMQHIQDTPAPPTQLNPNIPPALEEIILRCLEKVPEMRFRDGSVLARALEMLGEEDSNSTIPANLPSTGLVTPTNNGVYNRNGSTSNPGTYTDARPSQLTSSPNNNGSTTNNNRTGQVVYNQNGANQNGALENGAATALHPDQMYAPLPADPAAATMAIDQRQMPYGMMNPAESGATRPFNKGQVNGRAAVVGEQHDSRAAGIVTLLILLATLLLLGFSIYLAGQLGFLPFGGTSVTPTATTPTVVTAPPVAVPDLVGKDFADAQNIAQSKGFKLQVAKGPNTGRVKKQAPEANSKAASGSTILVELEQTVKIQDLAGKPLADAITTLKNDGLQYKVASDPNKPVDLNEDPNVVTRTDPQAGSNVTADKQVTLYVTNYLTATPTAVPIIQPTTPPTPVPQPTPTPTAAPQPTPTDTPAPTPTKTHKPKPTATAVPPDQNMSGPGNATPTPPNQ